MVVSPLHLSDAASKSHANTRIRSGTHRHRRTQPHTRTHTRTSRSIGTERHRLIHQPDEHRVVRADHLLSQVWAHVEREKLGFGQGARPLRDHPSDRREVVLARSHACNGRERARGGWVCELV